MLLRYLSLAVAAMLAANSPALAVVIVNETFDYADEAALHAVWRGNPSTAAATTGTPEQVEERFQLTDVIVPNADFNADGNVDARDYVVWRNKRTATGPDLQPDGDANQDRVINAHDYRVWQDQYGQAPPTPGSAGTALRHISNTSPTPSLPDGNVVYQPKLDPNFFDGSIFPTAAEPIVAKVDIYVDSGALQRNTLGLRYNNPAANLLELGFYNGGFGGAAMRVALWQTSGGSTNPDWQYFSLPQELNIDDRLAPGVVTWSEVFERLGPGWHQFEMTITETSVTATVDLLRDGINNGTGAAGVDATMTFNTGITLGQSGFDSLRLGGPSQLATTQDAWFDNVFLSGPQVAAGGSLLTAPVPEPATWAVGLMAGLACVAARRRWRV